MASAPAAWPSARCIIPVRAAGGCCTARLRELRGSRNARSALCQAGDGDRLCAATCELARVPRFLSHCPPRGALALTSACALPPVRRAVSKGGLVLNQLLAELSPDVRARLRTDGRARARTHTARDGRCGHTPLAHVPSFLRARCFACVAPLVAAVPPSQTRAEIEAANALFVKIVDIQVGKTAKKTDPHKQVWATYDPLQNVGFYSACDWIPPSTQPCGADPST